MWNFTPAKSPISRRTRSAYDGAMNFSMPSPRLLLSFGCLLTFGCGFPKSGPVPGPVSADTVAAAKAKNLSASEESLATGRELFVNKCNNCHGHPDVNYKSEAEWPEVVKRMGGKADLDAKQSDAVLQFILANHANVTAAPAPAPAASGETQK